MFNLVIKKFIADPVGFCRRAFFKTIQGPLKYKQGINDYNAKKYWSDRLTQYGLSFRGVGEEGLSEEENKNRYQLLAKLLTKVVRKEKIRLKTAEVLDIGCGSGYFTNWCSSQKVQQYMGVDIATVLFPTLSTKYPNYTFRKLNITTSSVKMKFDLILLIDVIEHIVTKEKMQQTLNHVKQMLKKTGVFILVPVMKTGKRRFFYLRLWSEEEIKREFPNYAISSFKLFDNHALLSIRKR